MRTTSARESATSSAPNDSASCVRVRAPVSGTTVGLFASTHPIASCDGLTLFSAASFCSASISRSLRVRFSPLKRGKCARKSLCDAGFEPLSNPRDSTPYAVTPMPSSASTGKMAASGPRLIEGVLNLQIADRVHRVRATNGVRSHLRQPDGADVAGLHQISNHADDLFDGDGGIQAGWAIDVDVIHAEPRQRVREKVLHGRRPRVDAQPASVWAAQDAELHREERTVAAVPQRSADRYFVVANPIEVALSRSVIPASSAAWMVAMLSRSSAGPYIPDMPIQPSASGKTEGPAEPSRRGG